MDDDSEAGRNGGAGTSAAGKPPLSAPGGSASSAGSNSAGSKTNLGGVGGHGGSAGEASGLPVGSAGEGGAPDGGDLPPTFPTARVLDDFNRVGPGVGIMWIGAADEYSLSKQRLWCEFCGDAALWSTPFLTDQEVFATVAAFDDEAQEINLVLKAQLSSSCELIEVLYSPAEATTRIAYCVKDKWYDSEKVPLALQVGDQFGGRAHADGTVEIFANGAAVAKFATPEFPYPVGRIGVNGVSGPSGNAWDDFGGGNWR